MLVLCELVQPRFRFYILFFFNDTATTEIYTLSLHDALPISTDEVRDRLDWTKEFFLAHGFAVAEVAYRGSAGLGRAFRTSLNRHWGTYDVEDCLTVAGALLVGGIALPGALFLSGTTPPRYTPLPPPRL